MRGGELLELQVPFGEELVHYAVGAASCAVPGVPAGLDALWREHGRLPWADLCAPALRLARDGVEMPPAHVACLEMLEPVMTMREGARIYAPEGRLLRPGELLEQPGLVHALEAIAEEGAASVYAGSIAESLLALIDERGGVVTRDDLAGYEAVLDEPAEVAYAGTRFLTRGGLRGHRRRRSRRLPPLGAEPGRTLTLLDALDAERGPETHTTNLVTADADGNACVLTTSLGLGSGDWLPGLDLHLNSMLGEVDLLVGELEPGERMQSMMAPSVALDGDGPVLAIGSAGGTRLRTALVTVASSILDEGLEPQAAVDRPRVHRAGDAVNAEPGVDEDALARARAARARRPPLARAPPLLRRRQPRLHRRPRRRPASQRRGRRSLARADGALGRLDVARDLVDERLLAVEDLLVAKALPQLDHEPRAVQVAGEAEQERLDAELVAAVVRVRPDRDRRAMTGRRPGVDPVQRDEQPGLGSDVRGREAERSTAGVALHDHGPPPPAAGRAARPPRPTLPSCRRWRIVEDETPSTCGTVRASKPSARSRSRSPRRRCPNRKSSPATTTRAPIASRYSARELLRLEPLRLQRELDDERVLHAELGEQLQPPLERAEELDRRSRAPAAGAGRR